MAELESFMYNAVDSDKSIYDKKGCLVVNTAGEIGGKDSEILRELNLYYDFIREMLRNVIRNAIKKKELPEDTNIEMQANFFLGVMQGISVASKTMNSNELNDYITVALTQIKY